jgi:hypothetical protein
MFGERLGRTLRRWGSDDLIPEQAVGEAEAQQDAQAFLRRQAPIKVAQQKFVL